MQTISYFSNYYSELNLPTEEECKLSVAVYEAILSLDKQNDQYFDEIFSVFNAMDDSDHDDISIFFLIPHAKAVKIGRAHV